MESSNNNKQPTPPPTGNNQIPLFGGKESFTDATRPKRSIQNKNRGAQNKNLLQNAKVERHEKGIQKYKHYEDLNRNKDLVEEMMKGEKKEVYIPKPGEYVVITADKKNDKTRVLDIPIMELLDATKSFTELKEKHQDGTFQRLNSPFGRAQTAGRSRVGESTSNPPVDDRQPLNTYNENIIEMGEGETGRSESNFSTHLTRNLKTITKRQAQGTLIPSNVILSNIVSERVNTETETANPSRLTGRLPSAQQKPGTAASGRRIHSSHALRFGRPESANFVAQKLVGSVTDTGGDIQDEIKKFKEQTQPKAGPGKAKTTYQVRPKYSGRPQHITGHSTIKDSEIDYRKPIIEPPKERPITSPFMSGAEVSKETKRDKKKKDDSKAGYFLPLEYYFFDEEDGKTITPLQLIERYKDPGSEKTFAFSKWFYPDGKFIWCKCEVLGYDKEYDRYHIKWIHNNNEKKVSRVNLRFERESEEEFNEKIEAAEVYRQRSEIFLKYNYLIDSMGTQTHHVSEEIKDRIMNFVLGHPFKLGPLRDPIQFLTVPAYVRFNSKYYLIPKLIDIPPRTIVERFKKKNYNLELLNSLVEEVEKEYIRANHQIEFDNTLPYSEERQMMFRGTLEDEMFITLKEKGTPETDAKGLLQIPYEFPHKYENLILHLRKRLHQAAPEKIRLLLTLNNDLVRYENTLLVLNKFPQTEGVQLLDFIKLQQETLNNFLRDFKGRMFDTYYEISEMVEIELQNMRKRNEERLRTIALETERRLAEEKELPPDVAHSLKSYQSLVNTLFERSVRGTFERSFIKLYEQFSFIVEYFNNHVTEEQKKLTEQNVEAKTFDYETLYKFQTQAEYERPYESAPHLSTLLTADDEGHFELFPPPNEIYKKTKEYIEYVKDNLMNVECLRAKEIGPARENGYLDIILREDIFYAEYTTMLHNTVKLLMEIPNAFLEKLKGFKSLCNIQKDKVKSKLKKLNFAEFKKKLAKLKSNQQELERVLYKDTLKAGLVLIDVKSVKERLVKNVDVLLQIYFKTLIFKIGQENTQLKKDVDEILQTLKKDPTNLEELNDLRKYASELGTYVQSTINVKIADIMDKLNLLEDMRYKISYTDFESSWSSFGLPMKIEYKADKCLRRLVQMEKKFSDDLMEQQNLLLLDIQEIRQQLDILTKEGNYNRYDQMSNEFAQLGDKIERAQREVEVVNRRETLLKWKLNDYTEIEKIKKEWHPYNKVWNLAIEYHIRVMDVLNGPIFAVDRDAITTEIIESWNELFKLEKQTFKLVPHMLQVTQTVRLMYEEFKPNLPLINDLRNPALKPRHWQKISEVTGIEFDQESNVLSLKTLLDNGINQYKDQINEISEIASKEQSFERMLNKMKNDWKNIKFELMEFRNTETYILRQLEPILDKLDEDLTKTMSIASSPFIKFLENDVNAWKNTLVKAQDIIDIWVKVQKLWQYLQPIFFSEDILVQMPKAGVKYQQADKIWRSIMENVFKYPNVLETCATHKIRDNFGLALDLLEEVIKGLNDYLNKKRAAFPRFYFLSNDELLSILAQTREPKAVQKHLSKCFEGIEYLTFEEDLSITAMNSIEDEKIGFSKPINPLDKEGVPRNVEEWLADVEKTMKLSLREVFHKSLLAYSDKTRKKWLFDWPAQIVVLCDQTLWTSQVEKAIDATKTDTKSLEKCFEEQNRLLLEVVDLLKMDISKRDRITLGVLIVIEVHAKDVIEELVRNEVKSVQAFEWLAQMRYNYEMDKLSLNVAMVNTVRKYGYEYLGNQARLVITPLTDRCYRTLMSALQMNLGGAPEGPAGTGKTETTKDLAKALAKHCVVFNCSEALDYQAMGKFFKGLCACGSWACFDEFNRIELEVLSVIAQQILSIQNALIRGSKSFMFEDAMIPLEPSCAVFITMNPGYAGRSELPDNLKALFRPVAMMIPNYAMIAEISLYSYGFTDARALSIKITTSLKLSSEQLSSQSHYDFGMRAVKSIILAAGALKRAFPNDPNEAMLVLRAIKECNVPKFTTSDVPLFNAILSDLFPKAVLEEKDYGFLKKGIEEICVEKNYSLTQKFFVKIMELYETIQVRHGLMVVGATMCGKSSITKVLSNAIERASILEKSTKLVAEGKTEEEIVNTKIDGTKVKTYSLNPKSVTIQMLYGAVDPASNEWRDGITADIFRECKEDATNNLKWIIFDGPVDALWIENMNTVLDDNKKLCLMSGETIKLTDVMSIIFEVEDLLEASPATVSRCGMVFMESANLEWTSLFDKWKANIPSTHMNDEFEKLYNELNKYILVPIIELFQSHKIKTLVNVYITWVINMFLKALEAYIFKNKTRVDIQREIEVEKQKHLAKMAAMRLEGKEVSKQAGPETKALNPKEKAEVFACYISALIWSFSSIIDDKSKVEFERVLREAANKACEDSTMLTEIGKEGKIPVEQSIYEMFYDFEKKSWQGWIKHLTEFKLPEDIKFHEVYIPTLENLQNTAFLYQMVTHDFPVLFIGKTGTGKTTCVKKLLLNDLDQNAFIPTITVFSANTSCVNAQDVLESKLEKQKRRKGIYGPVVGFTNIIFIDDLNMPAKEKYGAQPPLELIRQWLDYGGWYDRKSLEFKTIADIQFLASMGVGRAPISNRLIRHFNIVYLNEMSDDTLKMIVRKTLDWGFSRYIDKVKFMTNGATNIIFKTYKEIQTSKAFLPLPSKSHYIFNMRDMLKVVQGILSVPPSKYEATADNKTKILRLLIHESICVYSDRLVNKEDKDLFVDVLREKIKEEYSLDLDSILSDTHLLYGNFMEMHAQDKEYQEIEDKEKLISTVEEYIAEYNSLSKSNKINVYLFDEAIALLIKINRIIASPFGNALLVGLGGSGRHTMCRLATYMQDYIMNEIEMEKELTPMEWYEFQKKMLRTVGVENKPVVFLASDSQIRDDRYFEDINSLLNIGEIPNLFTQDEKEAMIAEIKEIISKENKENREKRNLSPLAIWEHFVNNCKINLHIVLAMSPIGEKLRVRLRNFPSLVSCTSLLWVLPWSEGALSSVATSFLRDSTNIELSEEQKTAVANICVEFHVSVNEASKRYKAELGRNFYVTPISYMQLLQNLERLLLKKQQDSLGLIKKYESGILKLEQCTEVVESTKLELEDLKPKLNAKEKETEDIIKDIEVETAEAEKTKVIVMADEEETAKKAASAGELQAQCQDKLSEALPGLEAAIKALKTLKTEDFVEMKATLNKPPIPVRKTMEAVCIMLGKFAKDSDGYMTEAKKQVAEPKKLMERLENYAKDNIPDKVIDKLGQFLKENPNFKPEFVANASAAAKGLCLWVLALHKYSLVNKAITPLKEDLKTANDILQAASDELAKKRAALREIEDKILGLRMKFEQANLEKQTLKAQKVECEIKLERAFQLTSGLGSERERWGQEAIRLRRELSNLLGDILLAVGSISYLGAFTGKFREQIIIEKWIKKIRRENIVCSEGFSLQNTIGNPIEIQDWILQGLPLDSVSIDNAIYMKESTLWPLIIDPQKQATKFIKNKEFKEREALFFVTKPSDNLARTLEHVVRMGGTLLVENVGEQIDPILDPVLQKAVYVSGGIKFINIGNQPVEYSKDFRLYLVSNLNNPHYLPEVLTKVTLLNFTITYEGLKDQMLSIVAKEEEPKDEDEKIKLMYETSADRAKKKMLEDKILELLATSEGKILENEILIKSLTESKSTSEEIEVRLKHAKVTEDRINANRANYEPVAVRASHLFLTILQLSNLDPMYQYSLEWFIKNFLKTIKLAEKPAGRNLKLRVKNLLDTLCKQIYREVTRSVFEKHKLLFAFLMATTILRVDEALDHSEWMLLLTGLSGQLIAEVANPDPVLFSDSAWESILHLANLPKFNGLGEQIANNLEEWKEYSNDIENKKAPAPYDSLEPFRVLSLIKVLRPDLFVAQTRKFITDVLGDFFISPHVFTLDDSFKESTTPLVPLVFILSPGDDPLEELRQFAQEKSRTLVPLSLGKGQGEFAAKQIKEGIAQGTWVLLQNCHLAASWMKNLEDIVENLPKELQAKRLHDSFRLWLTTASSDVFPSSLLQTSVKMTKDPPTGVKANLMQIYNGIQGSKAEKDFFYSCQKQEEWRKLFLALGFFHAVIRERKRYGPIGWNIKYDFNMSDFKISMKQLHHMLNSYQEVPFQALIYLTGECYYGGRVTDDWDRRTLITLLKDFYNPYASEGNYTFSPVKEFVIPEEDMDLPNASVFSEELPNNEPPELFGLHANAEITSNLNEANMILTSILAISPKTVGQGAGDQNKKLIAQTEDFLQSLPADFDIDKVSQVRPNNYYESMNTVLLQELARYNNLLRTIRNSLKQLIQAMGGFIVMSSELENMAESLTSNLIPQIWARRSYPSLKPLSGYFKDLLQRLKVLQDWIDNGQPVVYWLSGFYFPQSFLTGVLQNYARAKTIPIDQLRFDFNVLKEGAVVEKAPETGCYITGLFLEGATWDSERGVLEESPYKVLYKIMPTIQFIPTEEVKDYNKIADIYTCPVYKTSDRRGTLSTTGHSTNFILPIYLKSEKPKEWWVKRGVAMITQLNE